MNRRGAMMARATSPPAFPARHRQRLRGQQFFDRLCDQGALFPAARLERAAHAYERRRTHHVATGLDELTIHEHVHHAVLVFQQEKDDPARGERLLAADHEPGQLHALAGEQRLQVTA